MHSRRADWRCWQASACTRGSPSLTDAAGCGTWLARCVVGAALAGVTAAALLTFLPDLRARNLQAFERAQLLRFAVIAAGSLLVMGVAAWLVDERRRRACGLLLVALAAADLVQAHRGFNPSVPRDRYYPLTDSLDWLREQASEARIAPVDTASDLIEGHVWGMYGLSTVTGFDFHGDADYQQFMRLAQQPPGTDVPARPATWGYVGLRRDTLDLRMLGVLGARYIVTAPLDLTPRAGGYVPIGPMVDGRTLTVHDSRPARRRAWRRLPRRHLWQAQSGRLALDGHDRRWARRVARQRRTGDAARQRLVAPHVGARGAIGWPVADRGDPERGQ